MKKVNKNSLALCSNSPTLRQVFGGQIVPNLRPYECNAQIICIRHLNDKLKNLRILENNRKEKEKDIRKEHRGLLLHSFVKRICSSCHKLARSLVHKSTSHMHLAKY